jgi:hypothetical protein
MSRGSRVGPGREIGPRCRGPKSPVNVELLQALKDRWGSPAVLRLFARSAKLRERQRKEVAENGQHFSEQCLLSPVGPRRGAGHWA